MNVGSIRVSYIISTRNRARFLAEALRNVREFITPADELIIVDGASTDDTAKVVAANQDIVTAYQSEPDFGEAHGYNKGILAARGRFIKPLTDDDYIYPQTMAEAIAILEKHPELDAVLAGGEAFELDPLTMQQRLVTYVHLPSTRILVDDLKNMFDYVPCGLGLILTRRCIERVGLFNTTFRAVDTEYMARLLACRVNFKYLNLKLFRHVSHAGSGQNDWPVCRRDRLRSLLMIKAWEDLFNPGIYPPSAVAEVLGLDKLPRGNILMQLIDRAERMRKGRRLSKFLPVLSWLIQALVWGAETVGHFEIFLRSFHRKRKPADASPLPPIPEPIWDATLR